MSPPINQQSLDVEPATVKKMHGFEKASAEYQEACSCVDEKCAQTDGSGSSECSEKEETDDNVRDDSVLSSSTPDGGDSVDDDEAVWLQEEDANQKFAVPPIIWMWWEQGWKTAPTLCQVCADSWANMNPDVVRKIDRSHLATLLPHLSLPERLPPTQRSDLVRLELLNAYGGVWVDSTLFCTGPIMPWLKSLQGEKHPEEFFFVFDRASVKLPGDPFSDSGLLISNWFIASSAQHPLCSRWLQSFKEALRKPVVHYFQMTHAFHDMVNKDGHMLAMYKKVPKVSASHPHYLEFSPGFTAPSSESTLSALHEALSHVPMQKLSRKVLHDQLFANILSSDVLDRILLGSLLVTLGDNQLSSFRKWAQQLAAQYATDQQSLAQQEAETKIKVYTGWFDQLILCGA